MLLSPRHRSCSRHVIGCHVTQESGVENAGDDVASNIWQVIGCHVTQEPGVENVVDDVASNIWQTLCGERRGELRRRMGRPTAESRGLHLTYKTKSPIDRNMDHVSTLSCLECACTKLRASKEGNQPQILPKFGTRTLQARPPLEPYGEGRRAGHSKP